MRCPNCGVEAFGEAKFCSRCGYSFEQRAMIQPQRRGWWTTGRIIAVVIVFVVIVPIVLSAILYVMVLGFGGTSIMTPAATYTKAYVTGGERVSIVSITKTDVPWSDVGVQIENGYDFAEWDTSTADLDGGSMVTATYAAKSFGALTVTLTVTDVSGNGFVSGSDYFTVTADPAFLSAITYYAVLIYEPTGERIGTGVSFNG